MTDRVARDRRSLGRRRPAAGTADRERQTAAKPKPRRRLLSAIPTAVCRPPSAVCRQYLRHYMPSQRLEERPHLRGRRDERRVDLVVLIVEIAPRGREEWRSWIRLLA